MVGVIRGRDILAHPVVAATDSEFVRRLEAFQSAETTHLCFIADRIGELAPGLAEECEVLRAQAQARGAATV